MMNHLKLILISFTTVFTMLAYQNCQKMGFNGSESESDQNSLSVDTATVSFELNYHMGYGYCMGRCLTGTKISADLTAGVLNIDNYIWDNQPAEASAASAVPEASDIGTKFTIQLTQEQLTGLKKALNSIEFEERFIPECVVGEPCAIMVDHPSFTHYFKNKLGETRKVFTSTGIDPNLRGEQFLVMDNATPLACQLKAIIESTALKAQEKEDSITGLETALNFYEGYNPLVCSN